MIFISYRITDSLDLVGRLDADLCREFGADAVFRDKSRLHGGHDWPRELEDHAKGCRVMLVVIGATWKSASFKDGDFEGMPRLFHQEDWVRKEITLALDAGKVVIPVFLNGASMPAEGWLATCKLERLYRKQGENLRTNEYAHDLPKLVDAIREQCPELPGGAVAGAAPVVAKRLPVPPDVYAVPNYILTSTFIGRATELDELDAWAIPARNLVPPRCVKLLWGGEPGRFPVCADRYLFALYRKAGEAMLKGTLNYAAEMKGLQFDELEVQPAEPAITRTQLACRDGRELQIAVHFSAVGSQDEARTLATQIIGQILDRLAFTENRAIAFPREVSAAFSEIRNHDSPNLNLFVSDYLYLKDSVRAIRTMGPNAIAQLKATLECPAAAGEQHYAAFRQALNAEDLVDQYMSLFRILADLRRAPSGKESQNAVDDFIHRQFGEPLVPPPHRPDAPETVYTRLRNEVAHVRPGVVPETTRQEIRNYLSRLVNIVKRAIELS